MASLVYHHKISSVLWAQGSVPVPLAERKQHFLIRPWPSCQGWTLQHTVVFHSPHSAPLQALNVALVIMPPPLQSPHPTHCHSLPEPAPLSWINSPKASPTQGLPGSGLLEAAQGSRKSNRGKTGLTCACDFSQTPDFWDPGLLLEKEGYHSRRAHVLSFCKKSFPIRLPSLLPTLLISLNY